MKRKIAAIDGSGQGVCIEGDLPEIGPGEVLVRVQASLISPGTELGRVGLMRETPILTRSPVYLVMPTQGW